jgi:predicted RNA-binding protein YlqC (UPF0109 family)
VKVKAELEQFAGAKKINSLLLQIIGALVDDPRSIELLSEELDGGTCFRVRVGRSDVGKLIGKQGRTARSIRTVLGAASMKYGHRFTLDILEEEQT